MGKKKKAFLSVGCILFGAAVAIAVHILMPSGGTEVNVESFDGVFVKAMGFPVVATLYFVLLYAHIWFVVTKMSHTKVLLSRQVGWRLGLVFSSLYMIGMQEVVVEASPLSSWGTGFVVYQFFIGLGDALPALLICILLAKVFLSDGVTAKKTKKAGQSSWVLLIAVAVFVFIGRLIGYKTGVITGDIDRYPVQVICWTIVFAIAMACYVIVLSPLARGEKTRRYLVIVVGMIGLNWIIFNSFMGLIMRGLIPVMLLRSGIDMVSMMLGVICALAINKKRMNNCH